MSEADEILAAWRKLPPLVRAATAGSYALCAGANCNDDGRDEQNCEVLGMTRRAAVTRRFYDAHSLVADLFAALANEADAEAVALGFDVVTRAPEADR